MPVIAHLLLIFLLALAAPPLHAHGIVRQQQAGLPIASSITVPEGSALLFVGGTLADVSNPEAPAGSAARLGDTAAQARSVLAKIEAELKTAGFAMGDIVKMDVYLVADPDKGGRVDAMGLTSAYLAYSGPISCARWKSSAAGYSRSSTVAGSTTCADGTMKSMTKSSPSCRPIVPAPMAMPSAASP
jgi:enamine deaminase RidA (YjgF/YER057c/UK114 family)